MSALTQFLYRAPKSVGLINGSPTYDAIPNLPEITDDVRVALYSPNGQYFAFTQPSYTTIINPNDGSIVDKIENLKECLDLHFSPNGSFLSIWEKPVKLEPSGNYFENVKIYDIENKRFIGQYTAKDQSRWKPDFTADEKVFAKLYKNEIRFFQITDGSLNFNKPWSTLQIDGVASFKLSPGQKHTIATFVPEKNAKPATVSVWNIGSTSGPISTKSFFKAERCILKWNALGTSLLALASTDVDASNKSYYGETTLYLLGIAGSFDSRINLSKDGPIHDITWSPSSREFGVVYGYMPASTAFFDARGNSIYSLPPAPKNTILFSPHGRYILVAGFGNLQGSVDIYDRLQKWSKIASFEAPNTSVCKWSPDGRYILTATTSPRLRVDNGVKIWYASGKLIFNKDFKEVFSFDWRPRPLDMFPPIRALDENPMPHQSGIDYILTHPKSSSSGIDPSAKPKGAYRPPHARNGNSSAPQQSLYQKEVSSSFSIMSVKDSDSGGGISSASSSNNNNNSNNSSSFRSAQRQRSVPGAAAPVEKESRSAMKNRKKREAKKNESTNKVNGNSNGNNTNGNNTNGNGNKNHNDVNNSNNASNTSTTTTTSTSTTNANTNANTSQDNLVIGGGHQSLEEKKIRGLLKKLRAIEQLKMKQANNETLEDTQLSKIQTEEKIRNELHSLGWNESE